MLTHFPGGASPSVVPSPAAAAPHESFRCVLGFFVFFRFFMVFLYKNIFRSFGQNSQSRNSPNVISRIINQQTAIYSFNGTLLKKQKE